MKAGGKVTNGRINGGLNISRAFGDFELKSNQKKTYSEQMVTSIPEIIEVDRSDDDQFIVIASDGVWEHFHTKNDLFADRIRDEASKCSGDAHGFMSQMLVGFIGSSPESEVGCDNMTMVLTQFGCIADQNG